MCIINLFALLFQIATEENRLRHSGNGYRSVAEQPCWLQCLPVFPLVSPESSGGGGGKTTNKQIFV